MFHFTAKQRAKQIQIILSLFYFTGQLYALYISCLHVYVSTIWLDAKLHFVVVAVTRCFDKAESNLM